MRHLSDAHESDHAMDIMVRYNIVPYPIGKLMKIIGTCVYVNDYGGGEYRHDLRYPMQREQLYLCRCLICQGLVAEYHIIWPT